MITYSERRAMFKDSSSALRRATGNNRRNLPCPSCNEPNRLTPADKRLGYQCDNCADIDEGFANHSSLYGAVDV